MKQQKKEKVHGAKRNWAKGRIEHYKPSTIRSEAEQDYLNYKETGRLRQRSPDVGKKTLKAVVIVAVVTLVLMISSILVEILG